MKTKIKSLRRLDLLAAKWRRQSMAGDYRSPAWVDGQSLLCELAGDLETAIARTRGTLKRKRI